LFFFSIGDFFQFVFFLERKGERKMRKDDCLVNCVTFFRLALEQADGTLMPLHFNLRRIYYENCHRWPLRYDPQQFGSANLRIDCRNLGLKNVGALIFASGKVVCPGSSVTETGLIMAWIIARFLSHIVDETLVVRAFVPPNIVGRLKTAPVDLQRLADVYGSERARYQPTGPQAFPACFINPDTSKEPIPANIVYLVFRSGNVIVTGCRSEESARRHVELARGLCNEFKAANQDFSQENRQITLITQVEKQILFKLDELLIEKNSQIEN